MTLDVTTGSTPETQARAKAIYARSNLRSSSLLRVSGSTELHLTAAIVASTPARMLAELRLAKTSLTTSQAYATAHAQNPVSFAVTRIGRCLAGIRDGIHILAPAPAPAPRPLFSVPGPFRRYVFAGRLSNFDQGQRAAARARGYDSVLVQLADGSDAAAANEQELFQHGDAYRAEGWNISGWGPAYDPEPAAELAAQAVLRHRLLAWASDWEVWGEGTNAALPGRFVARWRALAPGVPLGLSCLSSENEDRKSVV